jgi:hypothetical protein
MGLYDRDYMRDKPVPDDEDGPGLDRFSSRRRTLIVAGMVVIVVGMLIAWAFS